LHHGAFDKEKKWGRKFGLDRGKNVQKKALHHKTGEKSKGRNEKILKKGLILQKSSAIMHICMKNFWKQEV
jgi:hypothetical protein